MAKMGRPTRLTKELAEQIVEVVLAGNYIETSAKMFGVSKQTLYNWFAKGAKAKSGMHAYFLDAVKKAQAKAEIKDLTIIGKHGIKNWQAAAWRLERKFPDRYGRRQRIDITEEEAAAHGDIDDVDLGSLDVAELITLRQLLTKARTGGDANADGDDDDDEGDEGEG